MTERDYARRSRADGPCLTADSGARNHEPRKCGFVRPDQTTDDCMALMTERRMRHLPVMIGEKLVG